MIFYTINPLKILFFSFHFLPLPEVDFSQKIRASPTIFARSEEKGQVEMMFSFRQVRRQEDEMQANGQVESFDRK